MIGIYSITNIVNGKRYIGQSRNIEKRWTDHKYRLDNNCHKNEHLQSAWFKYGKENFVFEVLCECEEEKLNEKERQYIQEYNANNRNYGYCIEDGGCVGNNVPEEVRLKISMS